MKIYVIIITIFLLDSVAFAGNGFSSLFDNPRTGQPVTQGKQGNTVASLSAKCQKLNNLTAIAQVYVPVIWPRVGFPGTVVSAIQYRSPIINLCDYLIKLDRLAGKDALFHTEAFLNNLSGNKFNDHLALQDTFFNVANTIYDFNNGGFRQGALVSGSTHRRLVSAADQTVRFYNKHIEGGSGEGIETKSDRKRKLDEVGNVAYKRAILSEATACPRPKNRKDNLALYSKEVIQREEVIKEAERDIAYLRTQLYNMGKEINKQINDYTRYTQEVDELIQAYPRYVQSSKTFSQANNEWNGQFDRDGFPVKKDVPANKKVNVFTIRFREELYSDFRQKYVDLWETYVNSQFLSTGVFGLLDGKKGRIEEKYKSYSYECSPRQLENRIRIKDKSDPGYQKEMQKEREKCRDNLKVRKSEFENLMDEYLTHLRRAVREKHSNTIGIWNFEASTLGFNRVISEDNSNSNNPKAYQNVDVVCSDVLEPVEMKELSLRMQQVKVEMRQRWMESEVKLLESKVQRTQAEAQQSKDVNQSINNSIQKGRESSFSEKRVQPISGNLGQGL